MSHPPHDLELARARRLAERSGDPRWPYSLAETFRRAVAAKIGQQPVDVEQIARQLEQFDRASGPAADLRTEAEKQCVGGAE